MSSTETTYFTEIPEKLFKHCKKQHLPKKSHTIRVGSLNDYRIQENSAVRDDMEGSFALLFDFKSNRSVSIKWLEEVSLGGCMMPGMGYIHGGSIQRSMSTIRYNTGNVTVAYDHISLNRYDDNKLFAYGEMYLLFQEDNVPVFCMSKSSTSEVIVDDGYDSTWYIDRSNIEDIIASIARELAMHFETRRFDRRTLTIKRHKRIFPDGPSEKDFIFKVECGSIEYIQRLITVSNESDFPISKFRDFSQQTPFRKRPKFEEEEEFRIVFRPGLEIDGEFVDLKIQEHSFIISTKELEAFIRYNSDP